MKHGFIIISRKAREPQWNFVDRALLLREKVERGREKEMAIAEERDREWRVRA